MSDLRFSRLSDSFKMQYRLSAANPRHSDTRRQIPRHFVRSSTFNFIRVLSSKIGQIGLKHDADSNSSVVGSAVVTAVVIIAVVVVAIVDVIVAGVVAGVVGAAIVGPMSL